MCGICRYAHMYKWSNSDNTPSHEEQVLVVINGTYKESTFENAYALASYINNVWIIEGYEDADTLRVYYWTELPDLPDDIRG